MFLCRRSITAAFRQRSFDRHTDEAFTLCVSPFIVEEVKRILTNRFDWTVERLETILDPIFSRAQMVDPTTRVAISADPDDNRILECALESRSDVIVTGASGPDSE